jgi:2-polyprenyl-3-methyl-5-hydroxy-6-metoxy-1,4-benzoquinol methylase
MERAATRCFSGHRVVATDIAEEGIAKARTLADARGVSVEFRHLDLQGWQWPEAEFDAVVAVEVARVPDGRAAGRGTAVH